MFKYKVFRHKILSGSCEEAFIRQKTRRDQEKGEGKPMINARMSDGINGESDEMKIVWRTWAGFMMHRALSIKS